MVKILAIDPGQDLSGFVLWDCETETLLDKGKVSNDAICDILEEAPPCILAMEKPANMGNYFGDSLIDTCIWLGRFWECYAYATSVVLIKRHEVKQHLCHQQKGVNDAVIRAAIIDRFGGKEKAIGTKAKPGKLYGLRADMWQALAVALCCADRLSPASSE